MLSSGTLTELAIHYANRALLDAPAAALLGNALRANATLTALTLYSTQLWSDHAGAATLLGALTGHASLRQLGVTGEWLSMSEEDKLHAGMLLGALVAANAPALTALDVSSSELSDDGMRPLFEALPRNSHLRTLNCSMNRISNAFAADVLLPAVRANTLSARALSASGVQPQPDAAREAEELVKSRSSEAVRA
jgi:hypothetical protein